MHNYIQEFKNSLTPDFCEKVITLFENEPNTQPGSTISGVNKTVKNTTDYSLDIRKETNENWLDIEKVLFNELCEKLQCIIIHTL